MSIKTETKRIYLSSPHMSKEGYEKEYVNDAFDTNWIAPLGINVDEFEKEMISKIGAKDAVALSSGTAAIHLALKCVDIKEGDIVFCSTLTFSATVNPILYERAIPVFIDSEFDSWNMSPEALKAAFEKYSAGNQLPKAVIVVHLYGMTAKLDEIGKLCRQYNVPLIEDAAESLGSSFKQRMTGTFGDYGIISFNGNKIITSSGGGMLLCNTQNAKEMAEKARFWATQSRDKARHYQHSELGYNYRMSNVVAGIGRGQLKVLEERIKKKRYIYLYYKNRLQHLEGVAFMPADVMGYCNCWLSVMLIHDVGRVSNAEVMDTLEHENIESRPVWKPMHKQPVFKEYEYVDHDGVSQYLFEHGVCLPSDTKMTNADLDWVCNLIERLWL